MYDPEVNLLRFHVIPCGQGLQRITDIEILMVYLYKAVHAYKATDDGELTIKVNDIIEVEGLPWQFQGNPKEPRGWILGKFNDVEGKFPSFVDFFGQRLSPRPPTPPLSSLVSNKCNRKKKPIRSFKEMKMRTSSMRVREKQIRMCK
ncbi:uncharacterized protein LOC100367875 [Saccoglossus kowalevskii]